LLYNWINLNRIKKKTKQNKVAKDKHRVSIVCCKSNAESSICSAPFSCFLKTNENASFPVQPHSRTFVFVFFGKLSFCFFLTLLHSMCWCYLRLHLIKLLILAYTFRLTSWPSSLVITLRLFPHLALVCNILHVCPLHLALTVSC